MALDDDEWIGKYSPIEAQKLHALGIISFMWNACEYKLFELFHLVFGITPEFAWLLIHDLGDISISTRIVAFLEADPTLAQEHIVIKNALEAYNACRLNRNQYTHFMLQHDLESQSVILLRQQKGVRLERVPFPQEISDMRRVAQELVGLNNHIDAINTHIKTRGSDQVKPLPGTVAVPELLWKPHPENNPAPQPQPEPSVVRLTREEWAARDAKIAREAAAQGDESAKK